MRCACVCMCVHACAYIMDSSEHFSSRQVSDKAAIRKLRDMTRERTSLGSRQGVLRKQPDPMAEAYHVAKNRSDTDAASPQPRFHAAVHDLGNALLVGQLSDVRWDSPV